MNTAKRMSVEEIAALPIGSVVWGEIRCGATLNDGTDLPLAFIARNTFVICVPGRDGYLTGLIDNSAPPVSYSISEGFPSEDCSVPVTFWTEKPDMDMLQPGITEEEYNRMSDAELLQLVQK